MLSSVPEECRWTAALVKSLLTLAATIVDDVSDKLHDTPLLEVLLKAPFENIDTPVHFQGCRRLAVTLCSELFDAAYVHLRQGRMWDRVEPVLAFDLKQVWNAFAYAHLLNGRPEIINHVENTTYGAHNMMFYVFGDIDLTYSPVVDHECSHLREVFWHAQQMARIGNWVSTWERELHERDWSSGVVSWGVSNRLFQVSDLNSHRNGNGVPTCLRRFRELGIEGELLRVWTQHRDTALELGTHIRSVDVASYIDGMERVLIYHLASRGMK
jgi:hypothetical protein